MDGWFKLMLDIIVGFLSFDVGVNTWVSNFDVGK